MDNLIQYLKYRNDLSFLHVPFNEIDALVFSILVYFEFEEIVSNDSSRISLEGACRQYLEKNTKEEIEEIFLYCPQLVEFIHLVYKSKRYKQVQLSNYIVINDHDEVTQFGAMTFNINNKELFVAYRGTDNSILGWQENLKMLYQNEVISYHRGMEYLNQIIKNAKNSILNKQVIYVGGHSKGGNLAMASYLKSKYYKRIKKVFNFDGPGFKQEFIVHYNNSMFSKIYEYAPRASIVGRIFEHVGQVYIMDSYEQGLSQHDPLYWHINGNGFILVDRFDDISNETNVFFTDLIYSKDIETRQRYAVLMGSILGALDIEKLIDFKEIKLQKAFIGMKEFSNLKQDEKKFIVSLLKYFIGQSKVTLFKNNK